MISVLLPELTHWGNMYIVEKKLKNFAAAHRLVKGNTGRCSQLHGHTYRVNVALACESLDGYDFVIDFDEIKTLCDQWVQTHWDHATIVCAEDKALWQFVKDNQQKHYVLPDNKNTTSECLAEHLFQVFSSLFTEYNKKHARALKLMSVSIAESQTAKATYQKNNQYCDE